MKKIFLFLFIMLTSIYFVNAYSNVSLQHYFTFDDGTGASAYDTLNGALLISSRSWTQIDGKVGHGLYSNPYLSNPVSFYNTTFFNFGDNSWSVNFWTYSSGSTGYPNVIYGYQNSNDYATASVYNATGLKYVYSLIGGSTSSTQYCTNCIYSPNYVWYMVTITYNLGDYKGKIYINGNLTANISAQNIASGRNYFIIKAWETGYDEMSIWNTTLNDSDIQILYNNSQGLNFVETMASGTGYQAGGNFSQNFSNQTNATGNINNSIVTGNYNFTIGYITFSKNQCYTDSLPDVICNQSYYFDPTTTDFYGSHIGCPDDSLSFCPNGTLCVNTIYDATTHDLYEAPNNQTCTEVNATLFNYKILCSPFIINNGLRDLLFVLFGYNCTAPSFYTISSNFCTNNKYDVINANPTHNWFVEGQCQAGSNCAVRCDLNDIKCNTDNTGYQKCIQTASGCFAWNTTLCPTNYECFGGECVYNPAPPSSGTGGTSAGSTSPLSAGAKIGIIFFMMLTLILLGLAVGYMSGLMSLGLMTGTFMVLMLLIASAIPSFPLIGGFTPVWFAIMMFLLLLILAIFFGVKSFTMNKGE